MSIIHSTAEEFLSGVDENTFDFVFTDPPYNVGKKYDGYNDNRPDYQEWMAYVLSQCRRVSRKGIVVYVAGTLRKLYTELMPDAHMIVVYKRAAGVRKDNFSLQYHLLFCEAKPIVPIRDVWDDIRLPGEGYFFREPRHYNHPGLTSLKLTERVISSFTNVGDKVFDPFVGTGTTIAACANQGVS